MLGKKSVELVVWNTLICNRLCLVSLTCGGSEIVLKENGAAFSSIHDINMNAAFCSICKINKNGQGGLSFINGHIQK